MVFVALCWWKTPGHDPAVLSQGPERQLWGGFSPIPSCFSCCSKHACAINWPALQVLANRASLGWWIVLLGYKRPHPNAAASSIPQMHPGIMASMWETDQWTDPEWVIPCVSMPSPQQPLVSTLVVLGSLQNWTLKLGYHLQLGCGAAAFMWYCTLERQPLLLCFSFSSAMLHDVVCAMFWCKIHHTFLILNTCTIFWFQPFALKKQSCHW